MANNRKSNQPIRLTEQDLHFLVEEAVKGYLVENVDEDFWGGAKTLGQRIANNFSRKSDNEKSSQSQNTQPQGNIFNRMGQKLNNFGNSVSNARKTFQMGSANGDAQKAITNALNALNALADADRRMKSVGGAGLMGDAQKAVYNAIQALSYNGKNAGNVRNQFSGSQRAAAEGGKFIGWN